jgi:hypothetical protein
MRKFQKKTKSKHISAEKLAEHQKNMSITMKWTNMAGINPVAAAAINLACEQECQRRINLVQRQLDCEHGEVVKDLMSDIIQKI